MEKIFRKFQDPCEIFNMQLLKWFPINMPLLFRAPVAPPTKLLFQNGMGSGQLFLTKTSNQNGLRIEVTIKRHKNMCSSSCEAWQPNHFSFR